MNVYDKNHPHNAVFVAQLQSVIDGAPRALQHADPEIMIWRDFGKAADGTSKSPWREDQLYRLKPLTVTRTLTYPEPLRVAPAEGTVVWVLNVLCPRGFSKGTWVGYSGDKIYLSRGFIFATESDAAEAARAIFGGEL